MASPHGTSQDSDEYIDKDNNNLSEPSVALEYPVAKSKEWICQVERFEKQVDSRGRSQYYPARKPKDSSSRKEAPEVLQKTQTSTHNKPQDQEKGAVIAHIYDPGTRNHASSFLEPESYIDIRSPLILEVLQDLANDTTQSRVNEPYRSLWHKFEALQSYVKDRKNPKDYRDHISVLLDFLVHCDMPNVSELIALSVPGAIAKTISYSNLWFLCPPGTMVVTQGSDLHNSSVLRVMNATPPTKRIDSKGKVSYHDSVVDCEHYGYRSGHINSIRTRQDLDQFEGFLPVTELRIVPLNLLHEYEEKQRAFIARGKKFWDLQGQHLQEIRYGSDFKGTAVENERVMVDAEMYERFRGEPVYLNFGEIAKDTDSTRAVTAGSQPSLLAVPTPKIEALTSPLASTDRIVEPTDDILMLCDFWVHGFSFRTKKWQDYHVNSLTNADFNKRSFDRLVLREEYKMTLKAMVAQHFTQGQDRFNDLVAGKGQGLNILLHGPPGVGKTLTAECVADMYERPLYSVTSGDIGTDPETIERKLLAIFEYAVRWNALLLLDEADVFLAERNLENLSRNALVSVFLRNIGVGTIDEAFQSRIHITLGIDPLSVEDRRQLWYLFIKDLKHLSKDHRRGLAREARDNWAHKDFNGRQIRNAVKTALILARQDGVEVQASHFQTVLDIGSRFAGYMQRLKKMDRERFAEAIGTRLDLTAKPIKSPESPPLFAKAPKPSPKAQTKSTEPTDVYFDSD
ncbi:MAG: hypothetical protein Q9164_005124 [Protoblastenia rupestris]